MITLKDLTIEKQYNGVVTPSPTKGHEVVEIYYLRQEVIKWIKEDIERYRKANINLPKGEEGRLIHNFIVMQRQFWKDKFNIEEDLK